MKYTLSKEQANKLMTAKLSHFFGVTPQEASYEQFYKAIAMIVRDMMSDGRTEFEEKADQGSAKHVYYLCMEFLMGRSLKNNLYNLGLTDVFSRVLADYDIKMDNLYESEPDAGLGNGDSRNLLDGRGAAVVIDRDLVQNGGVGAACADGGQLMDEVVDTGIHFFFKGFRRAAHNEILLILR